jgi:hypothetical protein
MLESRTQIDLPTGSKRGGSMGKSAKSKANSAPATDEGLPAQIVEALKMDLGRLDSGGGYMDYVKRFNGAGVVVSVGFTGSYMGAGAERIAAALTDLEFRKAGARGRTLELAKVPPVLISEAIADLYVMAAAGTGFDADWQKKSHF